MKKRRLPISPKNSLAFRITAVIFISGPLVLLVFTVLGSLVHNPPAESNSLLQKIFQGLVGLSVTTIAMGWLASRLVSQPLKDFNAAIQSLKRNQYKTTLKPSGIKEFDEVFRNFNELSQRLGEEEELRKDLISDTSHELNTPLSAINGQLTAMEEDKLPVTKARISLVRAQSDRLIDLVGQLNAYTKARAAVAGGREPINLLQACRQAVSALEPLLAAQQISVTIEVAQALQVVANAQAVQQILANLITNTASYAQASELTISATKHSLRLADNGIGVPHESLPHLFERFYRVDASRSRNTGGLGLGLAIVQELAQQQGWTIHAAAANPGLTIIITFA